MSVSAILTLVLGGGGVAAITALFSGFKTLRESSKTDEKDHLLALIDARRLAYVDRSEALAERDKAVDQRDYWRNRAAEAEFRLKRLGAQVPEDEVKL